MKLFNKNKEVNNDTKESIIKVLGGGCSKCNELKDNTKAAIKLLDLDYTVQHINDFAIIATYGVMNTPALVINSKVVSSGKVNTTNEILQLLKENL